MPTILPTQAIASQVYVAFIQLIIILFIRHKCDCIAYSCTLHQCPLSVFRSPEAIFIFGARLSPPISKIDERKTFSHFLERSQVFEIKSSLQVNVALLLI